MEFVEVMKQKKRMCETYGMSCLDCKLYMCGKSVNMSNCDYFGMEYPEQAEEIIMKWSEEHPVKTNADKFKEVFGQSYKDVVNLNYKVSFAEYEKFWKQEYKEPKGE